MIVGVYHSNESDVLNLTCFAKIRVKTDVNYLASDKLIHFS